MARPGRLIAVGLFLALSSATTGEARVRKPAAHVVLDYRRQSGAERCPTKRELEGQVRDILGRFPFASQAPRTVRCVLRAEDGGLAARLQLLDSRSRRVLGVRDLSGTDPGCEELGAAVAFAIALAIDPLARPPRAPPVAGVSATPPLQPPEVTAPSAVTAPAPTSQSSGLPGSAPSAAGAGAMGVSSAQRTEPPSRSILTQDAGALSSLGLIPLVAQLDAGRPPRLDAGLAVDAGSAALAAAAVGDAGSPPATDAGVAVQPDAGPEGPATETGAPVLVAEPAAEKTGWRPVVGVGAVGAAGVLPGFAGGVLVHAGAASSTASVEIEGRWLPGTRQPFGTGSVSTSLVSGALVGCARFGGWGACGLALAGPVSGTGEGYSRSQEASAWIVSPGARAQWEWLFADPVGLRLHLDGAVNLVRPRFLVDSQEAWAVPRFSVWVGGGLFGRF
ncbi:MAG TPA: hypothetical protein VGK85_10015 [Myxococcaceae bacterium]